MRVSKYIMIILITFGYQLSYAQLSKVEFVGSTRILVYFDNAIPQYSSILSDNKQEITIKFSSVQTRISPPNRNLPDYLNEINFSTEQNNLNMKISVKNPTGYTIALLPYSKALAVDLFDWDKLSEPEDKFRLGLFALEDKISESAINYFTEADKSNIADASFFLGLNYLNQGKINTARHFFIKAAQNKSNISDIYAGLSQIESIKNNDSLALKLQEEFLKKSNLKKLDYLKIDEISEYDDDFSVDFLGAVDIDDFYSNFDTRDALKSEFDEKFKSVLAGDTLNTESNMDSLKTDFLSKFYIFILLAVLALIIIVLLYFKWRKNQLANIEKDIKKRKFNRQMQQAKAKTSAGSKIAAQAYKDAQESSLENPKQKAQTQSDANAKLSKSSKATEEKTEKVTLSQKQPSEIIEFIAAIKASAEKESIPEKKQDTHYSAKVELASHLAQEQQKIKHIKLGDLDKTVINITGEQLMETAKKLGIEQSCLETKQSLTNLESDSKKLSRIKDKFKAKD